MLAAPSSDRVHSPNRDNFTLRSDSLVNARAS